MGINTFFEASITARIHWKFKGCKKSIKNKQRTLVIKKSSSVRVDVPIFSRLLLSRRQELWKTHRWPVIGCIFPWLFPSCIGIPRLKNNHYSFWKQHKDINIVNLGTWDHQSSHTTVLRDEVWPLKFLALKSTIHVKLSQKGTGFNQFGRIWRQFLILNLEIVSLQ